VENMGDPVALEHIGHHLGACHFRHFVTPRWSSLFGPINEPL
jgi:hypothetical protein